MISRWELGERVAAGDEPWKGNRAGKPKDEPRLLTLLPCECFNGCGRGCDGLVVW